MTESGRNGGGSLQRTRTTVPDEHPLRVRVWGKANEYPYKCTSLDLVKEPHGGGGYCISVRARTGMNQRKIPVIPLQRSSARLTTADKPRSELLLMTLRGLESAPKECSNHYLITQVPEELHFSDH